MATIEALLFPLLPPSNYFPISFGQLMWLQIFKAVIVCARQSKSGVNMNLALGDTATSIQRRSKK